MGLALAQLPDWPAAMNRETALAYTGVAEAQLRAWEKAGRVRFTPRGPKGAMLTQRSQLDDALRDLFAGDVSEDLDFGND